MLEFSSNLSKIKKDLATKWFSIIISRANTKEEIIRDAYKKKRENIKRKILQKAIKKDKWLDLTMTTDELRHSEYPYTDVSWDRWIFLDQSHIDMDDTERIIELKNNRNKHLLDLEISLLEEKMKYCKKYHIFLIETRKRRKKLHKKWNIADEEKIPTEKILKKRLENICKTLKNRKKDWYLSRFWQNNHRWYNIEEYLDILGICWFMDEKEWFENDKNWELCELQKMQKDGVCILDPVVDSRQDWEYNLQRPESRNKKISKYSEEYKKEIKENLKKYPCDNGSYTIEQEGLFTRIVVKNSTLIDVDRASKEALNMRRKIKWYDFKNSRIRFDLSFQNYDDAESKR